MPNPAEDALAASGLSYRLISHGPVRSLAEAAQARGVTPADVVKTLVVRRGDDDFLFVLVPGDRTISWPKLRALLGVSRLSMPDATVAREVTGYERGTITPFGALRRWPVIADERMTGREITLGPASTAWPRPWTRTTPSGPWTLPSPTSATLNPPPRGEQRTLTANRHQEQEDQAATPECHLVISFRHQPGGQTAKRRPGPGRQ